MFNMDDKMRALYRNVFAPDASQRIKLICHGINTILAHVPKLLDDADLLLGHERFAMARFAVATADEELGKLHILIDAARLGAGRPDIAEKLGAAFYDHVAKYAYTETWRSRKDFVHRGVASVAQRFEVHLVKRWPDTIDEDGQFEPGMPHDTKVHREMKLYVDFQENAGGWIAPRGYPDEFEISFRGNLPLVEKSREHLGAFELSRNLGLFRLGSIMKFNEIWQRHFFGRGTNKDKQRQLSDLQNKTAAAIAAIAGCERAAVRSSPLCFWPCYGFLERMKSGAPSKSLLNDLRSPRIEV